MKVDKVEETFYINNYFLSITGSENFHQESRKKNLMQFFTGLKKRLLGQRAVQCT